MNTVIPIKKRGSFYVGGNRETLENLEIEDITYMGEWTFHADPNGTHWVKQMYVQYSILENARVDYPILMWHGGGLTGVTWETTPDGREGWDTLFMRYGYNVFVSDAVERGRASWAKFPEINPTSPIFHTYEARWLNLKMGETYPIPYEGQRFPVEYYDQLMMESVPRWLTSDEWTTEAYSKYIEKLMKKLDGVIIMAHSQGGPFAFEMARRYPEFVKALIMVEPAGYPGDESAEIIKNIPQLYVYGDFMHEKVVHSWVQNILKDQPRWINALKTAGADYTWYNLPEMGIKGNSHMLMMDNNNAEIAGMIYDWLIKAGF